MEEILVIIYPDRFVGARRVELLTGLSHSDGSSSKKTEITADISKTVSVGNVSTRASNMVNHIENRGWESRK